MKKNFILASHGSMAKGVYEAAEIITGGKENVSIYCAYTDGKENNVAEEVEELLKKIPKNEEIIVMTDLYGGSVNTAFVKQVDNYNLHLIAGMNLPLVLLMLENNEDDTVKMIESGIHWAAENVKYCNKTIKNLTQEDNF
ncbi:MAG: PTS sugar transporter [Herbinix sp.]|nr:PTS sugar transporter [Herbinix sp.]